jgi:hypothetical protein
VRLRGLAALVLFVGLLTSAQAATEIRCDVRTVCRDDVCVPTEDRTLFISGTQSRATVEVGPEYMYFHPEFTFSAKPGVGRKQTKRTLRLSADGGLSGELALSVARFEVPSGQAYDVPVGETVLTYGTDPKIAERAFCDYIADDRFSGLVWGVYRADYQAQRHGDVATAEGVFFRCQLPPQPSDSREITQFGWDMWLYQEDPENPDVASISYVKVDAISGMELKRGKTRDVLTDDRTTIVIKADGTMTYRQKVFDYDNKTYEETYRGVETLHGTCEKGPAY